MIAQLLSAVKIGFKTGSMLWPMTFLSPLLNVANAKSEVLLRGQDHALVQALVPFTREKEVTIQQVLVFCHKPLKRAVGMSNISMSSYFKHMVLEQR